MDAKEFNEWASRLQEVGKVIEKLPSEIRSEAFGVCRRLTFRSRQNCQLRTTILKKVKTPTV